MHQQNPDEQEMGLDKSSGKHPAHHYEKHKEGHGRCNVLEMRHPFLKINAMSILVDEHEPLVDVEDPPFEPRDVTIRTDKWVSDEFEILGFLGRGKFGEVKRCKETRTGREFAAKFIGTPRAQDRKEVEHEINIMKKLKHKRLLQMYDAFASKDEMCLVLEIILGGELFDRVIDDDFILTERACVVFMRQICEGVEYMHKKKIIHLDLKPENILCLTRTGNRVKIIDFGLAREFQPGKDLRVLFGTPEFMAPEVVQYEPINFATDMWSVGVICYVLVSGLSPFMGDTDGDTLANIIRGDYDFDYQEFDDISDECQDLIQRLIVKDKRKRLTATECLEHAWLKRQPDEPMTPSSAGYQLSKVRLKRFVYRRKWQKCVNAIIALRRMGVNLSNLRKHDPPKTYTLSPGIMTNKSKRRPEDGASGSERIPADGAAASDAPSSEKPKKDQYGSYVPKRLKASGISGGKEEAMETTESCPSPAATDVVSGVSTVECSIDNVINDVSFSPDTKRDKPELTMINYKYDDVSESVSFSCPSKGRIREPDSDKIDIAAGASPKTSQRRSPAPVTNMPDIDDSSSKSKPGRLKNNFKLETKGTPSGSQAQAEPLSPDKLRPQNVSGTFSWPVKPSELRKKASKSPSPKSLDPASPSTEGRIRYPRKPDFTTQKSFSKSPSPARREIKTVVATLNLTDNAGSPVPETIPENKEVTVSNGGVSSDTTLKPNGRPVRMRASKTPSPQYRDGVTPPRQRVSKSPSPATFERQASPVVPGLQTEKETPRVRLRRPPEATPPKPEPVTNNKPKVPLKPTIQNNRISDTNQWKPDSDESNDKPPVQTRPERPYKPVDKPQKPEKPTFATVYTLHKEKDTEKPNTQDKPKVLPKNTAIRMKPAKLYIPRKDHFLNFAELRNNFDMSMKLNAAQDESRQRELRLIQRNDKVNKIKDRLQREGLDLDPEEEEDQVAINNVKNDLMDKVNNRGHVITMKVKHVEHHEHEHLRVSREASPKIFKNDNEGLNSSTEQCQDYTDNTHKSIEDKPKVPPKPNQKFKEKFNMFEQISR